MRTYIEFLLLTVETGEEFTITVPSDTTASELANLLMPHMKKSIVSNVSVKEGAEANQLDECVEIVFNFTDPLQGITETEAERIISGLKKDGMIIPDRLTPSLFVEIYNTLEPEKESD